VVLHCAAQVAVTTSVRDPRTDFEDNALATFNVLEAVRLAAPEAALLFTSTNKVYGGMEDVEVRLQDDRYGYVGLPGGCPEDRPLDFHSPYGCSKGAADQYVRDYARIYGLRTVVFRQSCIYGYRQFGLEDQGWVAWFTIRAAQGKPVTIFGDGKQVRDVLFVDDLVDAFRRAVDRIDEVSGRIYNIGGGPQNTLSLLGAHPPPRGGRPGAPWRSATTTGARGTNACSSATCARPSGSSVGSPPPPLRRASAGSTGGSRASPFPVRRPLRPMTDRPPDPRDALVLTLDPAMGGGVRTMQRVMCQAMERLGLRPHLAFARSDRRGRWDPRLREGSRGRPAFRLHALRAEHRVPQLRWYPAAVLRSHLYAASGWYRWSAACTRWAWCPSWVDAEVRLLGGDPLPGRDREPGRSQPPFGGRCGSTTHSAGSITASSAGHFAIRACSSPCPSTPPDASRNGPGCPRERLPILRCPVDTNRYRPDGPPWADAPGRYVMSVGRVDDERKDYPGPGACLRA
jgi:CDP-paratose 2-epimerase